MGFDIEFTDSHERLSVEGVGLSLSDMDRRDVTKDGDTDPVWAWSRYVAKQISFSGEYVSNKRAVFLDRMKAGNLVSIILYSPSGDRWEGSYGTDSFDYQGNSKNTNFKFKTSGMFTGALVEGGSKSLTTRTVGTRLDVKRGSSYKRGYQDKRIDGAVRAFYLDGLTNANTGLESGMDIVESGAGGTTHAYPGDASLLVHDASIQWHGPTAGYGYLHYARGATDCIPSHVNMSQGFVTERQKTQGDVDSGSNGSVCDAITGITVLNTIKVQSPVYQFDVPCVWTIAQFRTAIGTLATLMQNGPVINNGSYTIDGVSYATRTIRMDGVYGSPVEGRDGAYMRGAIRYTWKPNTWKDGKLICIRYVQLPLEGSQTVNGWSAVTGFKNFYQYASASLTPVATLCARCYS